MQELLEILELLVTSVVLEIPEIEVLVMLAIQELLVMLGLLVIMVSEVMLVLAVLEVMVVAADLHILGAVDPQPLVELLALQEELLERLEAIRLGHRQQVVLAVLQVVGLAATPLVWADL